MGSEFKSWAILTLLLKLFPTISECNIGDACWNNNDCGSLSYLYECKDGHCECKESEDFSYNENVTERCMDVSYDFRRKCWAGICLKNAFCNHNKKCECRAGYVKFIIQCKKIKLQKVLQSCYKGNDSDLFICDTSEHSVCKSGKCVCYDKYFPNTTSGKCEHQSSYLKLHNLLEYKVKPGVYCKKDSHCISGLWCKDFKCACPDGCSYNSTKEVCDCGEAREGNVSAGPMIVGLVLGIVIVLFWYDRIKKTINRLKSKINEQRPQFSAVPRETSNHNSYTLNQRWSPPPAISENTNAHPAGFNLTHSSYYWRQFASIPPKAEPLSAKTEPSSINQPDIMPYPINPTAVTPYPVDSSQPPPPYSENTFIAPPPYSIHPPQDCLSAPALPCSGNSEDPLSSNPMPDAPYTYSPSDTPFPSSPSASAYPSNPYASPNPLNTYNTSYPSNPYMAETGSSVAPPAYNPAFEEKKF